MPTPDPLPDIIYKIHPPNLSALTALSDLDRKSGFIHLSTADLVPITADRFFSHHTELWLQIIRVADVAQNLKWEESGDHTFPHVYREPLENAIVGLGEVVRWKREEGSSWGEMGLDGRLERMDVESHVRDG